MVQPKVGLLGGRAPPSARLLRRPRPDRGALLPGPLSLLCLCLAAGFLFLLLTSSRMDSVMSRSNKGVPLLPSIFVVAALSPFCSRLDRA